MSPCSPFSRLPRSITRAAGMVLSILLLITLLPAPASALRVMTYNLLNYPSASGDSREDDFRAIFGAVNPDAVVVQEISISTGAAEFLSDVLNTLEPGQWAMAPFVNGYDSDNAFFYRTSAVDYLSMITLNTALRDINGYVIRPDGYTSSAAEFRMYSAHLKASTGTDNEAKRLAEAQILRTHLNALPAGSHFMLGADFNIYDSGEPAWDKLTGSEADNDGRLFDPINRVGDWNNNYSFRDVHTQSTRTTSLGDGGATGGMDDRFDMMLVCDDLLDGEGLAYINSTYTAYGQDGNHFNLAVNASPTNSAVGQTMANHLAYASDHLPVFFDLQLPSKMLTAGNLNFGQVLVGTVLQTNIQVENNAPVNADDLDYTLGAGTGFSVPGGSYSLSAGSSDYPAVTVDTSAPAALNTSVMVSGDAPDNPSDFISATATVVSASRPSLSDTSVLLSGAADFGSHKPSEFSDLTVDIHNYGFGSLQALLEIYDHEITGVDASRFSLTDWSAQSVGAAATTYTLRFDDDGAMEEQAYSAQLVFSSRDDSTINGSLDRSDLTVDLTAYVEKSGVPAPPVVVRMTRLYENIPNPFNPTTEIRFDLSRSGRVDLEIYNVQGRKIRTLVSGTMDMGSYRKAWDGKDDEGRSLASGVYFYRLKTVDYVQTRRMTMVQ